MSAKIRNVLLSVFLTGHAWAAAQASDFTRYCQSSQRTEAEWDTITELATTAGVRAPYTAAKCAVIETAVASQQKFFLRKKGLTTLKPLFYFPGVTEILASQNAIQDLEGIEKLSNLELLDLSFNKISDISPLRGLRNLHYLRLNHNEITDIDDLASLRNLEDLGLSDNAIKDISPLLALKKLSHISMANNELTSVAGLERLPELGFLLIGFNKICDLSQLTVIEKNGVNLIGKDTQECASAPN